MPFSTAEQGVSSPPGTAEHRDYLPRRAGCLLEWGCSAGCGWPRSVAAVAGRIRCRLPSRRLPSHSARLVGNTYAARGCVSRHSEIGCSVRDPETREIQYSPPRRELFSIDWSSSRVTDQESHDNERLLTPKTNSDATNRRGNALRGTRKQMRRHDNSSK